MYGESNANINFKDDYVSFGTFIYLCTQHVLSLVEHK